MGVKGRRVKPRKVKRKRKRKRKLSAHDMLCEKVGKWLKKHINNMSIPNCPVVAVNLVTIENEIPDVIGWCSGRSVMIEVKTSRADFIKDKKKFFRIHEDMGVGDLRYYCCPNGLIKPDEIPNGWGLLYEHNDKIKLVEKAVRKQANLSAERNIMYSLLRRQKRLRK